MALKLVVNNDKKKTTKKRQGLNHKQLCSKLQETGGTYLDREQVVLQNLRDMGLMTAVEPENE